jgi:hypothetical protein
MMTMTESNKTDTPSRRTALRRLACASVAAYVVPEILFMSAAQAGSSQPSKPRPLTPLPAEPPTAAPSGVDAAPVSDIEHEVPEDDLDDIARERCNVASNRAGAIRISRSDLARSQEAIRVGNAKPLEQIWGNFTSNYDGRVIGVEFLGQPTHTRYRFRAISATGRLETVTISAQTGSIEKIVGCG